MLGHDLKLKRSQSAWEMLGFGGLAGLLATGVAQTHLVPRPIWLRIGKWVCHRHLQG